MFNGIKLLHTEVVDGKRRAIFNVKDTCFSQDIEVVGTPQLESPAYLEPIAVFKVYDLRKLHIARNLAIFYITLDDGVQYIDADKIFIDIWFKSLEYGKKYHKLVKQYYTHLNQLVIEYQRQEEKLINSKRLTLK